MKNYAARGLCALLTNYAMRTGWKRFLAQPYWQPIPGGPIRLTPEMMDRAADRERERMKDPAYDRSRLVSSLLEAAGQVPLQGGAGPVPPKAG